MKNKDNYTEIVIKNSKKELLYKFITAIFIRGLLLIIPIFWSKTINNLSQNLYKRTYSLIIVTILLTLLYYIWQYLNQVTWFRFYNKLYLEYTSLLTKNNKDNIKKASLGEYTNVINNDIDIICNFIGNGVVRIVHILEFIFIYLYFLTLNIYIFIITIVISIIMILLLIISGSSIKTENIKRKTSFDRKTVIAHELYEKLKQESKDNKDKDNNNVLKKFYQSNVEYLKANYSFNLLSQALIYFVLAIIELSRYIIILYSVYLISKNIIEVGTIVLIYTYYDKIIVNFEVLGTISAEYQSFKVSQKRVNKLGTNIN